jgi:hypothetical protein
VSLLRRKRIIIPPVIAFALVVFLFVPVVQYSVSFQNPHAYDPKVLEGCDLLLGKNFSEYEACIRPGVLPATTVKGYASLAYSLSGWPVGPFPSVMLANQAGEWYLLHFNGASLSYVEYTFYQSVTTPALNPAGVVRVDNVSLAQWAFGYLNFSAKITNIGTASIWGLYASFNYPTYGVNGTLGTTRTYMGPRAECGFVAAGQSCTASLLLNESSSLLPNQIYPLALELDGRTGTAADSPWFVYVDNLQARYPGVGLNSHWVTAFVQALEQRRNGTLLTENKTLDEFAAFRYDTIRQQFQISDYNFTNDYNRYFAPPRPAIFEEILYPAGRDPATYPAYLQKNALEHYDALVNPTYTKYGYFFGTGPAVEVGPGCSATELPGPNINVIQFAVSHGCSYVIADEIWFIMILSG